VHSDSQLVECVLSGDVDAFGELVKRYERNVLAVAFTELRDVHAAEDVAQAAFLLAFARLETLRDASRFGAWLVQIARRQAVDALRKCRAPVCVTTAVERAAVDAPGSPQIERSQLLELVGRLPEHERILIGLRYFDAHSVSEISEITGRPVGTVTKQLSRAMTRLRALYEKE
jgi:RNA polymerase sigma-70 factor (ECF subfamily)